MEPRVNLQQAQPEAYKAMLAFSAVLNKSTLSPIQKELIKIRASQINACAFCLDMHTKDALKYGETTQRIFLLNAWKETTLFTAEEKAMLAITEEVTLIHQAGITDATYLQARQVLSDQTISDVIMAAIVINAWNRIAISSHTQPAE
jgi:AhpD family alkylhydroperoxidase